VGSKSSAPPPPDYTPVANASKESAEMAYKLGQEQLQWAKDQYAQNKGVTDQVVDSFLQTQALNNDAAAKDRARYEQIYQPLEDQLASDAKSYASDERKDLERGRAVSNVAQQFDAQRQNAIRDLESYGVNPGSTRFAALDIGTRAQQAATQAAAANQSDQMVDATARALRSEAINVGRGYPGQIAGTYNTALQSGSGAVNAGNTTTATGAQTMGTAPQYMGLGNQAVGTWGNTLTQGYNAQMNQFNANQKASSGWGSALGLLGSVGLSFLADGGVPGDTPDGAVPTEASPTRGKAIDDVPARLTAGEFVVPKEAVNWYGQSHFYKLIERAQKEKEEMKQRTGAIPQIHPATAHAVNRAPARMAVPMQ